MDNKPLLPLQKGDSPYAGKNVSRTKFIRLGMISAVDYETGYCEVTWLEEPGFVPLIRIPSAHSSLRSTLKAMPEIGSIVLCGCSRQTPTTEDTVILGFIDLDLENLLDTRLLRNIKTSNDLKIIDTIQQKIGYNVTRGKRRKIYPGEINAESTQGAELNLDEDVYISDSKLNEIEIRSADKSIRFSSSQIYTNTQASRSWNGLIVRDPGDLQPLIQQAVLPNGQKVQFITDTLKPLYMGGRAFTEHRNELYELSDGVMKASEVNSGYDVNVQQPFITTVLGTLVGNDKTDTSKYGKILRPQIFGTSNATEYSLDYLECKPEEWSTLASSFHFKQQDLNRIKQTARIDIDKEGHLFTFFAGSTKENRSWDAAFEGSIKLVVGSDNYLNKSLVLDTKGGVRATLGYDNVGNSLFVTAKKGIHLEIMNPANDGYAYNLITTKGIYNTYVNGNCFHEVVGDYTVTVHGKYAVKSLGTYEETYVNDKNVVYGGSYKMLVMKDLQENIAYNRVVKITGNLQRAPGVATPATPKEVTDKLTLSPTGSREESITAGDIRRNLLLGDLKDTVTVGNINSSITTGSHTTKVKTGDIIRQITSKTTVGFKDSIKSGDHITSVDVGNITQNVTKKGNSTESITAGNKKISIKTGAFTIEITTGDIKITTKTGKIKVDSAKQTVDINGMASVTVKGTKINLKGPSVNIGPSPAAMGGIIVGQPGTPSHLDYLTGLPLIGRPTIRA